MAMHCITAQGLAYGCGRGTIVALHEIRVSSLLSSTPSAAEPFWRVGIPARIVVSLGLSQVIAWGTMHYLIAVFAGPMQQALGWSPAFVQAGFSLALLVMGLSSGWVGAWIDRHGGRAAMMAGCWIGAVGCVLLATTQHAAQYVIAWGLLGLAMRLAQYDAAFAALAFIAGAGAKRAISIVTLFGGFASTVFWPVGQALQQALGWRMALACYAGFLVACSLLHLALPKARRPEPAAADAATDSVAPHVPIPGARLLYGFIAVAIIVLQTGMAAHFIELLQGRGWSASTAVTIAMLLGFGQVFGRLGVVFWGHGVNPVRLNLLPGALICGCLLFYLLAGGTAWGAAAFAFLYGAGNGIATITRGAMPLVLFDTAQYGRIVGGLLRPAFALAAAAPVALAALITAYGTAVGAGAALVIAVASMVAAVLLHLKVRHRRTTP